jgi:hypothetical protein
VSSTIACHICSEEHAPRDRYRHEKTHADLDHPARVPALGSRPRIDRKEQERQPVRHHGEAAERRRLELLEQDPVADHVLDAVGHHGERSAGEKAAEGSLAQGGERTRFAHGCFMAHKLLGKHE